MISEDFRSRVAAGKSRTVNSGGGGGIWPRVARMTARLIAVLPLPY